MGRFLLASVISCVQAEQQGLRQMKWGRPPRLAAPARPQGVKLETAQMRDLVLDGSGLAVGGCHDQAALRARATRAGSIR